MDRHESLESLFSEIACICLFPGGVRHRSCSRFFTQLRVRSSVGACVTFVHLPPRVSAECWIVRLWTDLEGLV